MELSKEFQDAEEKAIDEWDKIMDKDYLYFRTFYNGDYEADTNQETISSGHNAYFVKAITDMIDLAEKDHPDENIMEKIMYNIDYFYGTGFLKGGNE